MIDNEPQAHSQTLEGSTTASSRWQAPTGWLLTDANGPLPEESGFTVGQVYRFADDDPATQIATEAGQWVFLTWEQTVIGRERLPLDHVLATWRPGSQDWSWGEEAADVIDIDGPSFAALVRDIAINGVREPAEGEAPILLGDDGRVWDGHHRLLAARIVGASDVPVEYGTGGNPNFDQ